MEMNDVQIKKTYIFHEMISTSFRKEMVMNLRIKILIKIGAL